MVPRWPTWFYQKFYNLPRKKWRNSFKICKFFVSRKHFQLTKKEWGKQKVSYHDIFFTSIALLEKLKTVGTYTCGTIRSNHKGIHNLVADSKLKRGQYDIRVWFSNLNIAYYKWKENRIVHLASNYHSNVEDTVTRKENNGSKYKLIAQKLSQTITLTWGVLAEQINWEHFSV